MSRRRSLMDEGVIDWLMKPIGDEPTPREKPKFKKGDRVRDAYDSSREGRVYRAIEWGKDRWKYGVEWDDGKVQKATDTIEPMRESKMNESDYEHGEFQIYDAESVVFRKGNRLLHLDKDSQLISDLGEVLPGRPPEESVLKHALRLGADVLDFSYYDWNVDPEKYAEEAGIDLYELMDESRSRTVKLNRKQIRKLVEGALTEGSLMSVQERLSDCIGDLYYAYRDKGMDGEEAVRAVEEFLGDEAKGLMDTMVVNDPDGFEGMF